MIVYANEIQVLDGSTNLFLFHHQVASIPTEVFWDELVEMYKDGNKYELHFQYSQKAIDHINKWEARMCKRLKGQPPKKKFEGLIPLNHENHEWK
jgi:hypothetical protein